MEGEEKGKTIKKIWKRRKKGVEMQEILRDVRSVRKWMRK